MELNLPDLCAGYVKLVRAVRDQGHPVTVRGLPTRELTGVTLVFDDVTQPLLPVQVGRGVNVRLAAVEALGLVAGVATPALLVAASPRYGDVLVDPSDLTYGAYGPRVSRQLYHVVGHLDDDPTTRQAVLTVWRPEDLTHRGDRPCTVALQFLSRGGRLDLHAFMRSQDAWLGSTYDHFMFSQLQLTVASLLGLTPGRYVHHVTSLHLYEHHLDDVDRLLARRSVIRRPPAGWSLPRGVVPHVGRSPLDQLGHTQRNVRGLLDTGVASREFTRRNRWYVDQIRRLHRQETST